MQIDYRHTFSFDGGWNAAEVRDALAKARSIVLVAHTNADGDAVGAVTGMYCLLRQATSASVTPMLPDGCPDDLAWLPCTDRILSGATQHEACLDAIGKADLVMGLDVSSLDRTGNLADALRAATPNRILIDHHIGPDRAAFGIVVSEPEISSTCELVYWLMRQAYGRDIFTPEAAKCLYTGLCTDTGTFAYSNTQANLYLAAAELIGYGIDPMDINRCIKNVFTEARLKFFGHAMAERLTVYREQRVALMVLTAREMDERGVASADLTGLINEVMKLKDVDCSVLVREEKGKVRLSLRSKTQYDVNRLASEMFGGGGHERAAGATSLLSLDETVAVVKKKLNLEDR